MTQKEKLTKLLSKAVSTMPLEHFIEFDDEKIADIADYLLANGVVVLVDDPKNPPCWTCNHGWGSIGTNGYKGCEDSCEELRAYNSQYV